MALIPVAGGIGAGAALLIFGRMSNRLITSAGGGWRGAATKMALSNADAHAGKSTRAKRPETRSRPTVCRSQINNPESSYLPPHHPPSFSLPPPFCFFDHGQIEFGASSLVTAVFAAVPPFSPSPLRRSQPLLVSSCRYRVNGDGADAARSCFMVIAPKQPSHFQR